MQYSVAIRNARLDVVETTINADVPRLLIFEGSIPANCAAADAGTVLVNTVLPSDWLAAASGGQKSIANNPWALTGIAAGNGQYFRIKNNANSACHIQGSVSATGGGGDLQLNNTNIANGQDVNITAFTLTAGNA